MKHYDVIISGAGPSGSLLGYLLAQKGITVLIIEKEEFPRYKICAGGLQYRAIKLLPFTIDRVVEKKIDSLSFSYKSRERFVKKYSETFIYTVERRNFDLLMTEKARLKGCLIGFNEEVKKYEINGKSIIVQTSKGKYSCKILVGADGVRGAVHKSLVGKKDFFKILAYETEISSNGILNENDSCINLDFGGISKGYCWIFPKKEKLSCGIGGQPREAKKMKEYLSYFLGEYFKSSENTDSKILAHGIPVRVRNTPLCKYRVMNIGDAACLADGFTGEGIFNALKSSIIAYDCIKASLSNSNFDFLSYQERIEKEIYEKIKISLLFSKIFFGAPKFFFNQIKDNDRIFDLCCRALRGEESYGRIAEKLEKIKKFDFLDRIVFKF